MRRRVKRRRLEHRVMETRMRPQLLKRSRVTQMSSQTMIVTSQKIAVTIDYDKKFTF